MATLAVRSGWGILSRPPRQQQQLQPQLHHEVEKADAQEEQRGVNACLLNPPHVRSPRPRAAAAAVVAGTRPRRAT